MSNNQARGTIKDLQRVAIPLVASSRLELVKKQLANNHKHDAPYHYFDFQKDGKLYICWYYKSLDSKEVIE